MRRRHSLLLLAAASVAALGLVLSPTPRIHAVGADIPLFDAHVHWSENAHDEIPLERALAILDKSGVRMAAVSSTSDEATVRMYRADPKRVVPMLRPYRTRADMGGWAKDASIPPYLAERLKLGVHKGIGEFHLYGEDAASPVMKEIVAMAVARNLVLHAHSDARAVEILFRHDSRARILWAHAGFTNAAEVGAMMARYPNLWVETAIRHDIGPGGALDEAWKAVFLKYPDRWLVGTDSYITSRWHRMPEIHAETRSWLAKLPREVAEKMAWRNGVKLFGVPEDAFTGAAPAKKAE
ncbi:MAG: amidohydrolase family protein [Candidatus Odyssella sp.]|nr:amidohydrolase family protein [Candidatus Odyssella sp.]